MGRDLCYGSGAALQIFETADDVLGYPLTEVCFDGPEDRLRDTRFAQPAIVPHATLLNIGALAEATRAGVTATT